MAPGKAQHTSCFEKASRWFVGIPSRASLAPPFRWMSNRLAAPSEGLLDPPLADISVYLWSSTHECSGRRNSSIEPSPATLPPGLVGPRHALRLLAPYRAYPPAGAASFR